MPRTRKEKETQDEPRIRIKTRTVETPLENLILRDELRHTLQQLRDEHQQKERLGDLPPRTMILILGEPGTGRRTLAQAIAASLQRPLAELDLAALLQDDLSLLKRLDLLQTFLDQAQGLSAVYLLLDFDNLLQELPAPLSRACMRMLHHLAESHIVIATATTDARHLRPVVHNFQLILTCERLSSTEVADYLSWGETVFGIQITAEREKLIGLLRGLTISQVTNIITGAVRRIRVQGRQTLDDADIAAAWRDSGIPRDRCGFSP